MSLFVDKLLRVMGPSVGWDDEFSFISKLNSVMDETSTAPNALRSSEENNEMTKQSSDNMEVTSVSSSITDEKTQLFPRCGSHPYGFLSSRWVCDGYQGDLIRLWRKEFLGDNFADYGTPENNTKLVAVIKKEELFNMKGTWTKLEIPFIEIHKKGCGLLGLYGMMYLGDFTDATVVYQGCRLNPLLYMTQDSSNVQYPEDLEGQIQFPLDTSAICLKDCNVSEANVTMVAIPNDLSALLFGCHLAFAEQAVFQLDGGDSARPAETETKVRTWYQSDHVAGVMSCPFDSSVISSVSVRNKWYKKHGVVRPFCASVPLRNTPMSLLTFSRLQKTPRTVAVGPENPEPASTDTAYPNSELLP
ncbi:MAG: hypothetical protein SGARI_003811 [Bacillariaceae sp.]